MTPLPAHLESASTESTVYYCGAGYLGIDRCEACDRFCRPLATGGLCPC